MYTSSFSFFPWNRMETLAGASLIKDYLKEVVAKFSLERFIHYSCPVVSAAWSSDESCWTLETPRGTAKAKFVFFNVGYYDFDKVGIPASPF